MSFKRKLMGPVALGAITATSRPGFNRKPLKQTQILALPLSKDMSDSIGLAGGIEAKKKLPKIGEQNVYTIDSVLMNQIRSRQDKNECVFFLEYIESGKIISYVPTEQSKFAGTNKLKRAIACGKKKR